MEGFYFFTSPIRHGIYLFGVSLVLSFAFPQLFFFSVCQENWEVLPLEQCSLLVF